MSNTQKKNVPELRFPGFEGEWEEKKLGEFCEFNNGINAKKEQYGMGRKFINVLDILNNNFITYESIIGKVSVPENVEKNNKVEIWRFSVFKKFRNSRRCWLMQCVFR